jgi:peroxiredoxin
MVKVGDKVPSATLRTMGPEGPKAVTTEELFAPGKKVVAFALPGAFTPTCSAKHVPGFLAEAAALKAKGVDEIVCISVNDAFVMGAWGKDQKVGETIKMLGDGNGEFSEAMGLTMDGSKFGLGKRSQRYAMIVDGGVIKGLFVEKPGAFEASTAENVLKNL